MSYVRKTSLVSLSFFAFTLLLAIVMTSRKVSADESVIDEINISVPASCSLDGTGMNSHNATINNGQYNSAIGETTLHAFCNDSEGFAIYAIGYTDDTDGKTVLTNSVLGSTYDIPTGTATSGNTSNWAMKLTTQSSPTPTYPVTIQNSFNSFHAVPNDYTLVAKRESATDVGVSATGSTLATTYQAYISPTQPAGTYTGKVKYILTHPGQTVPNTIRIAQKVDQWASSLSVGEEITMIDIRDNKTYTAALLADGNLWMTQNLDLFIDSTKTYTSSDTDLPEGATWTPLRSTYTIQNANWCQGGRAFRGECYSNDTPESITFGERYWNEASTSGCFTSNEGCLESSSSPVGDKHYSMGTFYNLAAASAVNDVSVYTSENHINSSICPAGWQLPSEESFASLFYEYSNNPNSNYFSSPLYFVPLSYVDGDSDLYYGIGYSGDYYHTIDSPDYAYFISIYQNSHGSMYDASGRGAAIRCFKNLSD